MKVVNKAVCMIRSNPVKPDSRVEKEALALVRAGYHVHILAWDRDQNHKPLDGHIEVAEARIPITWLGHKASFGEGFKNIIPYLGFQISMCRWLISNRNAYSIVHACDFDTAFFSSKVASLFRKKIVFDIFDFLYGEPKGLIQKLVKNAQIRIINKSNGVIICTEERKKQIEEATPRKLTVIHNTPSTEFIESNFEEEQQANVKPKVVYVGILQDYRLLLEISEYFMNHNEVELHIGGFGKYETHFSELAEKYDNIKYYGRMMYQDTLKLESTCDIMLAIYDPSIENHRFAAPNKFYESLMLGKPVIMVKGTGMSPEVSKNDIGSLIDYSLEGFEKGINELIARREEWGSIQCRMQRLYKDVYSWEKMEKRLVDFYRNLD